MLYLALLCGQAKPKPTQPVEQCAKYFPKLRQYYDTDNSVFLHVVVYSCTNTQYHIFHHFVSLSIFSPTSVLRRGSGEVSHKGFLPETEDVLLYIQNLRLGK